MTSRSDIIDGSQAIGKKYGLIYTRKCGWVDLGRANPDGPDGAKNLWDKILNEKDAKHGVTKHAKHGVRSCNIASSLTQRSSRLRYRYAAELCVGPHNA